MERLTKRELLGGHNIAYASGDDCFDVWSVPKKFMGNAIDRLAYIEDILGDNYDLSRLRDLVQADRDGRCVVLPCKIGERIYKIVGKYEQNYGCDHCLESYGMGKVCDYFDVKTERCFNMKNKYQRHEIISKHFSYGMIGDIGKTVFLTREAAEEALKGENHG